MFRFGRLRRAQAGEGKGNPGSTGVLAGFLGTTQSHPWFRPAILALPGPLIPRVIFVLEGWTSASLNLSVLPVLPISACLVAAHSRLGTSTSTSAQCARPVTAWQPRHQSRRDIRRGGSALATLAASSTAMTSWGPGPDLLGPILGHSDDGQALPSVLSNLLLNG